MNPAKKFEQRVLKEAERALQLALLQAEAIRSQALASAAAVRDDAWRVAQRISNEIRALASDETATLLEQTRLERETLFAEHRAIAMQARADAAEQTREILADAHREADEMLRQAELRAAQVIADARIDEARVQQEADAGVARVRAEAAAAAQQIRDDASRESEAARRSVNEEHERRLGEYRAESAAFAAIAAQQIRDAAVVETTVTPVERPVVPVDARSTGRGRRVMVAIAVVLGLSAIGGVVWAFASSDTSNDTSLGRRVSSATTTPSFATGGPQATSSPPASTVTAGVTVAGSDVTKPASVFDGEGFYQTWTSQASALAPAGLRTSQQQPLRKPVVEGAVGDTDTLTAALTDDWVKGYGAFFGSDGGGSSSSATATVYQYGSATTTDRAFRVAQRAYVSSKADGVTELGAGAIKTSGARWFGVRYVDGDEQIVTVYIAYPGSLVQLSATSPSGTPDAALQGMVATITQWATAAGFE